MKNPAPSTRAVNRRTVTTGLAWSVPAVAATAAAPLAAASVIVNPGINGWVLNSASGSCSNYSVTISSAPSNPRPTPDGAPYGLYLYDTNLRGRYDAARMVYWIRGDHQSTNPVRWSKGRSHSSCWSGPTVGTPQTKSDGALYTPYTWTYTCEINPEDVAEDGRLYLGDFHVTATFSQRYGFRCEPLDVWAYREIRVDPDGEGPQEPELQHFERKASLAGGSRLRSVDGAAPDSVETDGVFAPVSA